MGTEGSGRPVLPTDVSPEVSWFDRFAGAAAGFVARAWFFAACVLLVVVWAPSYFLFRDINLWQLIINTATTIVTFLLVALLQNVQDRENKATQHKLNAIADALADLMSVEHQQGDELDRHVRELRAAVGLEHRESST